MENAFNIFVFLLFTALWIGFAYALVASQGSLDAAWQWIISGGRMALPDRVPESAGSSLLPGREVIAST